MRVLTISTAWCFALAMGRGAQAQGVDADVAAVRSPTSGPAAPTEEAEWHAWASAALGVAAGRAYQGIGGDLALWATRNNWAFAVRRAATTGLFESSNNTYDTSLLIGRRIPTPTYCNVVVGAGAGVGSAGGAGSPGHEATVAFGAQALVNLYFVAVGLDAFAAAGQTRHFVGIGATVGLGAFRRP